MEPLNLTGYEIIDWKHMKQTNRVRLVVELTEQDSNMFGGVTAVACQQHIIFNGEWNAKGIQGNNNGFEKSMEIGTKKDRTIYQKFKDKCLEYSGDEYYGRIKKHLGIEHLKELEKKYPPNTVEKILQLQIAKLNQKMGVPVPGVVSIENTSDYQIWKNLFDGLNYGNKNMQENLVHEEKGRTTNV